MHQLVNNIGMWFCLIFFTALTIFGSALMFGAAYGIVMETLNDIRFYRNLRK